MKILAIRGKNLASLSKAFCIELDRSPLSEIGLFAITGPTGAGKSTILDAMCLALYNQTPRLRGRGGAYVGAHGGAEGEHEQIRDTDVRALLSRGSAQGYAEVEFSGVDGLRYRARWTVRRARNRVGGRLQAAQMELWRGHDEANLSSNKISETLDTIRDKIGLGFEQFCRSVLLSQGDFAAFLRADENERAQLLERMTGTEIYRQLSRACHEKHRHWHQQLRDKEGQIEGVAQLSETEREELKSQADAAKRELDDTQKKFEAAQALLHAARARAELEVRAKQSRDELAQVEQAEEAAAPKRERFEQYQKVAELRSGYEEQKKRQQEQSALAKRRAELEGELEKQRQAQAQAQSQAQSAKLQWEAGQSRAQAEAPALEQAKILDTEIKDLATRKQKTFEERELQERALSEANAAERSHAVARAELEQRRQSLALDEARAAAGDALWQQRSEVQGDLEQLRAQRQARGQDESKRRGLQSQLGQLRAQLQPEIEAQQQLVAALEAARAAQAALGSGLSRAEGGGDGDGFFGEDLESLSQQRDMLREIYVEQKRIVVAWQKCEQEHQQHRKGLDAERDTQKNLAAEEEQAKLKRQELIALQAKAEEAQRAWLELQKSMSFEEQRAQLRPDEPCPLCGSKEHPYKLEQEQGPWQKMALRGRHRHEELQRELVGMRKQVEGAEAACIRLREGLKGGQQRRLEGRQRFVEQQQEIVEAVERAGVYWQRLESLLAGALGEDCERSEEVGYAEYVGGGGKSVAAGQGGVPGGLGGAPGGGQGGAPQLDAANTGDAADLGARTGRTGWPGLSEWLGWIAEMKQEGPKLLGIFVEFRKEDEASADAGWICDPKGEAKRAPELLQSIESYGRQLHERLDALRAQQKKREAKRDQAAKLEQELEAKRQKIAELRNKDGQLALDVGRLEEQLQAQGRQMAAMQQRMEQRLAGVGIDVDQPAHLQEAFARWLEGYAKRKAELQALEQQERKLAQNTQHLAEQKSAAKARFEDSSRRYSLLEVEAQQKGAQRKELLSGQSVEVYVEEQKAARAVLESAHERALQALAEHRQKVEALVVQQQTWGDRLAELQVNVQRLAQGLSQGIERSGLETEAVMALLALPLEDMQRDAEALQTLALRSQSAKKVLAAREEDLQNHRQRWPELIAVKDGESREQSLREHFKTAQDLYSGYRVRLESDRQAQAQRAKLGDEVMQIKKQADLWDRMHDLIGHSEGQKFQKFAQSLTLDQLVALANRHLAELDRRYRLQRVPGERLNLQVIDTFMADEIRSVNSLSGGESFLVSLALALGLSSLSATTTRIESLFIDEGFGTLDRESLDRAIAALDALQATGRQIGMISHVEGLAEQLGAQLRVQPLGQGRSEVRLLGMSKS